MPYANPQTILNRAVDDAVRAYVQPDGTALGYRDVPQDVQHLIAEIQAFVEARLASEPRAASGVTVKLSVDKSIEIMARIDGATRICAPRHLIPAMDQPDIA